MKDYSQEKLINLIIYFTKNTKYCGILKLCKLLYFADFKHFKETGESITGMSYQAWPYGPVPTKLYMEVTRNPEKMKGSVSIIKTNNTYKFIPLKNFDDQYFIKDRDKNNIEDRDICNFLVPLTRAKKKVFLISSCRKDPTFLKWIENGRIDRTL